MKLKAVHNTWCKSTLNTRKVWFFSYTHITLHQVHSHRCTLTCLSLTTQSWSPMSHIHGHTQQHITFRHSSAWLQQHIHRIIYGIQLLPGHQQYSRAIPHKPLTSSLLRCNWFSSVLFLLSWVSKSNTLDWAALSLETARSRACSTYKERQLC